MYTVSERDMLMSIIAVLEDDNKTDLSAAFVNKKLSHLANKKVSQL